MTAGIAATGSRVAWYYIPEVTYGVTPATNPEFKPIRFTQNGLNEQASQLKTNELRQDRHIATSRRGSVSVTGDIVGELSYGTYDDLLEAAMCGTWATNVLVTGTTRRSFSILKRYLDIGVDTIYTGCEIDKLKLSFPLQEKITATFSVVGSEEQEYTVPVGATFDAATVTDYMTTFQGSLNIAGSAVNYATQLDLTLNNQIAAKYSLFNRAAYAMKIGMIEMSGQLSTYVEDDVIKNLYRNETDTPIIATAVDATVSPNSYVFTLPRSRLTSATDNANGDDLIIQQSNIDAILDGTSGTEFKITRIPHA